MAKQPSKPLPHDICDARGFRKYRKGAMVPESEYDKILASHVPQTAPAGATSEAADVPQVEKMPFVPGSFEGRPAHEVQWQNERGLAHDQYEAPVTPAAPVVAEVTEAAPVTERRKFDKKAVEAPASTPATDGGKE